MEETEDRARELEDSVSSLQAEKEQAEVNGAHRVEGLNEANPGSFNDPTVSINTALMDPDYIHLTEDVPCTPLTLGFRVITS